MKMTKKDYSKYVDKKTPNSKLFKNMLKAFFVGGLICCAGQAIMNGYLSCGLDKETAATAESITLVLVGAVLTGIGVYDKLAKFAGAGTLVPITGFSNSVVAPALEFKAEGLITGTAAKMFIISGPVIVYGISSAIVYGLLLCLLK